MSSTLTIRIPDEMAERLREKSRHTGLPVGRVVREFVEAGLSQDAPPKGGQPWRKYLGIIKGGPRDLSTRKGFSRG